jgi:polyhydroxyalkanoate synthesis regulator phasin
MTTPNLEKYASLRGKIAELEAQLKDIEELAIAEALDILANNEEDSSRVVYRSPSATIILQLRTHKPKSSDNADLETLAELAEIEAQKAVTQNTQRILLLENQISELQEKMKQLNQTDEGRKYLAEYQEIEAKLITKKPILAVKIISQ